MSDLPAVALLFQMILWQASFVAVAIDTTQVTDQRTLSDSNSTHYSQLFLNGHLYKTDSSVKLVPAFLYSLLFDFIRRTSLLGGHLGRFPFDKNFGLKFWKFHMPNYS